jgi:hypothetical protein
MAQYIQTGISLTRSQDQQIRALAEKLGLTYAETVRCLVSAALPFVQDRHAINYGRLITIIEFASLALDAMAQKLSPEIADRLLDVAIDNARKYHAA